MLKFISGRFNRAASLFEGSDAPAFGYRRAPAEELGAPKAGDAHLSVWISGAARVAHAGEAPAKPCAADADPPGAGCAARKTSSYRESAHRAQTLRQWQEGPRRSGWPGDGGRVRPVAAELRRE